MINLLNLLEVIASGEPLEVIDMETKLSVDPKKGEVLIHPFQEYEVLSVYSGVDQYKESYICIEVRRVVQCLR